MTEFWEENFHQKQEMWGFQPAKSALQAVDFFLEYQVKNVLIPGFGYGRNAQPFLDAQFNVTGIEISKTAIELAKKQRRQPLTIYHGSVLNMPFDQQTYEGIYCHALIHLLDHNDRKTLLYKCFQQLSPQGIMVFSALSKKAPHFQKGRFISPNRYEFHQGVALYYYDCYSIEEEFNQFNLLEITEIEEDQPMLLVKCAKP